MEYPGSETAIEPEPIAPKPSRAERRAENKAQKAQAAKLKAAARATGELADDTVMSVPAPGGRNKPDGHKTTILTRSLVLGTGCLLLLASCGVGSYVGIANTRVAAHRSTVTTGDLTDKYHLSTWDQAAGAAFASRYLDVCLTRYTQTKTASSPQQETNRASAFQSMSVGVEDQSCVSTAPSIPRAVTSMTYTGQTTPVPNMPGAKFVTIQAATSDGVIENYSVPVWFASPVAGTGPRVVGSIGVIPLTRLGVPNPDSITGRTQDAALATQLKAQFVPQFFTAWATSSATLTQFLAPGASPSAATGLSGSLTAPTVQAVTVYPEKSTWPKNTGGTFRYQDGSTAEMDVSVDMTAPGGNTMPGLGYRVSMIQTNGHWFVQDVQAGLVSQISQAQPPTNGNPGNKTPVIGQSTPAPSPTPTPTAVKPKPKATTKPTPKPSPKTTKK